MAKMFYTIAEVQQKLGRNEDEIKEMVRTGQIQEFRDRDKLMFKVEQIDLLAGGEDDTGEVTLELEESGSASALDMTGGSGLDLKDDTGVGLSDSREGTGISVFDTDHGGDTVGDTRADTSSETHVGDALDDDLSLDAVGSGSGLLDLTRESDDTSLGAELIEEVFASDENVEIPANASGLFEAAGADSPGNQLEAGTPMAIPMVVESYDGSGSGLGVGFMIGAMIALILVGIVTAVVLQDAHPELVAMMTSDSTQLMIWTGGLLAVAVVFGLIGMFIGKATE